MVKVGITILDGDVPIQNACIKQVMESALGHSASAVYGLNGGLEGLINTAAEELKNLVKDFTHKPIVAETHQSVLTCSREKMGAASKEDLEKHGESISKNLRSLGIDYLVVLSGVRGINEFRKIAKHIPALRGYVIIPKSMNNDIGWNDPERASPTSPILSLGYPTAVSEISRLARRFKQGAYNQNRIVLIETLGGLTGWACAATFYQAGDFALLPERFRYGEFEKIRQSLCDQVLMRHDTMSAVLLGLAESVPTEQGELVKLKEAWESLDKYEEAALKGKKEQYRTFFQTEIDRTEHGKTKSGLKRTTVTGTEITYEARWTEPTLLDMHFARLYAKQAVNALFEGGSGVMPYITLDKILACRPGRLVKEIRLSDVSIGKIDNTHLQTIPDDYLDIPQPAQTDPTKGVGTFNFEISPRLADLIYRINGVPKGGRA